MGCIRLESSYKTARVHHVLRVELGFDPLHEWPCVRLRTPHVDLALDV